MHLRIPNFIVTSGLHHRQPRNRTWNTKSGVRLTSASSDGVPFGRSLLILVYMAHLATTTGRMIEGSLKKMHSFFALDDSWRIPTLLQHLRRIANAYYDRIVACRASAGDPSTATRKTRIDRFDVIRSIEFYDDGEDFTAILGDELIATPANSFSVPRELFNQFVAINRPQILYTMLWCHYHESREDRQPVHPQSQHGPCSIVPIGGSPPQQLGRFVELFQDMNKLWTDSPFRLVGTGKDMRIVHENNAPPVVQQPTKSAPSARKGRKILRLSPRRRLANMRELASMITDAIGRTRASIDQARAGRRVIVRRPTTVRTSPRASPGPSPGSSANSPKHEPAPGQPDSRGPQHEPAPGQPDSRGPQHEPAPGQPDSRGPPR